MDLAYFLTIVTGPPMSVGDKQNSHQACITDDLKGRGVCILLTVLYKPETYLLARWDYQNPVVRFLLEYPSTRHIYKLLAKIYLIIIEQKLSFVFHLFVVFNLIFPHTLFSFCFVLYVILCLHLCFQVIKKVSFFSKMYISLYNEHFSFS